MFFENVSEIWQIAEKNGCSVFVASDEVKVDRKNAIVLEPVGKSVITIEQVREMIERVSVKQIGEQFVVIRPADKISEEAASALLKNLEEPNEKVHFVLITSRPSLILPTILSRASVYFLRDRDVFSNEIKAEEKVKDLAKRLMVAKPQDLTALAEEIAKKKDGVREYALTVLGAAIEMLYKSYFITGKPAFLVKLPKFLKAYECVAKNGHIKLQIVANLI